MTTSLEDASVAVRLAGEDTVTHAFTDTPAPAPGRLLLRKVTYSALGTFLLTAASEGGEPVARGRATTVDEGVAVAAESERFGL